MSVIKMRVIVAGSRNFNNPSIVNDTIIQSGFDITELVSGASGEVDVLMQVFRKSPFTRLEIEKTDSDIYGCFRMSCCVSREWDDDMILKAWEQFEKALQFEDLCSIKG